MFQRLHVRLSSSIPILKHFCLYSHIHMCPWIYIITSAKRSFVRLADTLSLPNGASWEQMVGFRQKCFTLVMYILRNVSASSWTPSSINRHTCVLIDTGVLIVDIFETWETRGPTSIKGKEGLRIEFQEVLFGESSINECCSLVIYWSVKLKLHYVYLISLLALFIRT